MKNRAFTLIEVIVVLVIIAIIALIAVPIVTTIIEKSEIKDNKESVDRYGHAVELAVSAYELEHGDYPNTLEGLKIEYTGSKVKCNVERIRSNGDVFLSECYVDGNKVEDKSTYDKYYHYGKSDREYVDLYGKELEKQTIAYVNEHGEIPENLLIFNTKYDDIVDCDVSVNYDGTIYIENCKVSKYEIDNYAYGKYYGPAVGLLISKANKNGVVNYNDGDKGEMYMFSHEVTSQTDELIDFRYIGSIPNNYITFNNEIWRIIGVFEVENEQGKKENRIKIMRNEKISNEIWGSNNNWLVSSFNRYLNGDYINSLDELSNSSIGKTKFYLGGIGNVSQNGSQLYESERSTVVYSERDINIISKIALMYPSDFVYTYAYGVDDACYTRNIYCNYYGGNLSNGWIYVNNMEWTLTPGYSNDMRVVVISGSGGLTLYTGPNYIFGGRPVLYLKSNVKFDSGDGTEQNPYRIKL